MNFTARKFSFCFLLIMALPLALFSSPRWIVIAPEKAGTFLLTKALSRITGKKAIHYFPRDVSDPDHFFAFLSAAEKNNRAIFCHISFDEEIYKRLCREGYAIFFILRDPRDQLVSANYMILQGHALAGIPPPLFAEMGERERIDELIHGSRFHTPIIERCLLRVLPWAQRAHISRFEELVGPKGGGSLNKQKMAIHSLAKKLGISLSKGHERSILDQLFGESWSFRRGVIGSFKEQFDRDQEEQFLAKYGSLMEELGYAE